MNSVDVSCNESKAFSYHVAQSKSSAGCSLQSTRCNCSDAGRALHAAIVLRCRTTHAYSETMQLILSWCKSMVARGLTAAPMQHGVEQCTDSQVCALYVCVHVCGRGPRRRGVLTWMPGPLSCSCARCIVRGRTSGGPVAPHSAAVRCLCRRCTPCLHHTAESGRFRKEAGTGEPIHVSHL